MFPGIFPFLQCVIGLCWYMLNVCKVSKGVFLPLFFWIYIHSLLLSKHLVDSPVFYLHHYVIHAKCLTKGEFGMFLNKEWTATKQLARCFSYSKQWPKALGETGLLCPRCIWCPIHSRKPRHRETPPCPLCSGRCSNEHLFNSCPKAFRGKHYCWCHDQVFKVNAFRNTRCNHLAMTITFIRIGEKSRP